MLVTYCYIFVADWKSNSNDI